MTGETLRSRVSVVVLARDEERCIARCLDSVVEQGFHQVVVADTGSVDATPRIVAEYRRLGVRPHHLVWPNSFALARNAAVDVVGHGWVVFLDADEWLAEGAARRLLSALSTADDRPDVVFAPRIVDAQSGDVVHDVPRIFRADGPVEYRGAVHEYPVVSGPPDTPVRLVPLDVDVHHDGYHPAVRTAKRKLERNHALLRQARDDDPANPRWLYFLLRNPMSFTDSAHVTGLCAELAALVDRGERTGDWQTAGDYHRRALAISCQALGALGDWQAVRRHCSTMDEIDGGTSPDGYYFRTLDRLVRTGITDDDLRTAIRLRQDEDLVARSTVCPAGRHLDALIALLLDLRRGSADAEEYRTMCLPWNDVFFADSRPRFARQ